jgi:PadR family transcriptional regulator, regulatory protein PadR
MSRSQNSPQLEIMPGTVDLIILRSLRWGRAYPHGIAKFIQHTSGDIFKIERDSLFPALPWLLQNGRIAAEWGIQSGIA